MSVFVDTSAWYAAAYSPDSNNPRAKDHLSSQKRLITSDHVLVETWLLINHRIGRWASERFWEAIRSGCAILEEVRTADLERAWLIRQEFSDQGFSIVDCTSFAVMLRLGVHRAVSFDADFSVFRFGAGKRQAFEVLS